MNSLDSTIKDTIASIESKTDGDIDYTVGDTVTLKLREEDLISPERILDSGLEKLLALFDVPACIEMARVLFHEMQQLVEAKSDTTTEVSSISEGAPSPSSLVTQQGRFVRAVCLVSLSPVVTNLLTPENRVKLFKATVSHLEDSGKLKANSPGVLPLLSTAPDIDPNCRYSVFSRDPNEAKNEKLTDPSARQAITVKYRLFSGGNDCMGTWGCHPLGKYVASLTVGFGDTPISADEQTEAMVVDRHEDYADHSDDEKKQLEELSHNHRLLSFIDFYTAGSGDRTVGWLDDAVVEKGLAVAARKVNNQHLVDTVKTLFVRMTDASLPHPRGLLLWGPPGTGKTTVADALGGSLGLIPVREDGGFAAGELMAGLQGGTEKNVMAILQRAWSAPWLMFCVFVDEVETLVPNRNNKEASSGGAGSSVLGVLLTYFGGTRIPNIFMFGATNMKLDIDAAFDRRMSGKIFVGLPTSRVRRNWQPRKNNGAVDSSVSLADDVRDEMSRLTMNFSGANMGMLMTELKLKANRHRRATKDPNASLQISQDQLRSAVGDVCDRERILFGSVSIPRLMERSDECDENKTFLQNSFACVPDILLQFRERWTGRAFLNLSSAYSGDASANSCPYLDFEMRGRKVHTFRQQSFEESTGTTTSADVFKRVLIDVGLALDMNAVKLIDNSFFLKEALKDENDIVHRIADEVMQCHEYQRSMVILDLDAAFVDVNFEASMAHETIHRSAVFNTMLSVAKEFARCEKKLESNLFIVCVTTYDCVAQRFEYSSQWPKNLMRKRQIEERDFNSSLQKCKNCHEHCIPDEVKNKPDCQRHLAKDGTEAKLVRKKDNRNSGGQPAGMEIPRSKDSLDPTTDDCSSYHWTCCGANYFTKKCGVNAAEHDFDLPIPAPRKYHRCSSMSTASWCNVCSEFPAAVGDDSDEADCRRCTPDQGVCYRPALLGKLVCSKHFNSQKMTHASRLCKEKLGADNWAAEVTLWWTVDPASNRRVRLPVEQAEFMALQYHLYQKGELVDEDGKKNDEACIELPWGDSFPKHRIHKFQGKDLASDPSKAETKVCATSSAESNDPNPESRTDLIRLMPNWTSVSGGGGAMRCHLGRFCGNDDPQHYQSLKH